MKKPSEKRYKLIGEYLLEAGLLTEAQVDVALTDQCSNQMMFGEIVVARGWVNAQTIEYLVSKIIEPERLSLQSFELSAGMARQPPRDLGAKQKKPGTNINWVG